MQGFIDNKEKINKIYYRAMYSKTSGKYQAAIKVETIRKHKSLKKHRTDIIKIYKYQVYKLKKYSNSIHQL